MSRVMEKLSLNLGHRKPSSLIAAKQGQPGRTGERSPAENHATAMAKGIHYSFRFQAKQMAATLSRSETSKFFLKKSGRKSMLSPPAGFRYPQSFARSRQPILRPATPKAA